MRRLLAIALALIIPAAAEEKWLKLHTENFEIYSTQGERATRDTLLYFEQLREFFEFIWHVKPDPAIAARIVQFSNENQFKPYRPNEAAAGYFQSGVDRDWIVLGGTGAERITSSLTSTCT